MIDIFGLAPPPLYSYHPHPLQATKLVMEMVDMGVEGTKGGGQCSETKPWYKIVS